MKKIFQSILKIFIGYIFFMISKSVYAASCGGINLPYSFDQADIVFTGYLQNIIQKENIREYQFSINETWKGEHQDFMIISNSNYNSASLASIPVYFTKNIEYIVFAKNNGNYLTSDGCQSAPLEILNHNLIELLSFHQIYIPSIVDKLDSLDSQREELILKRKNSIDAIITKKSSKNISFNNKNIEIIELKIDKGIKDGLFVGMELMFHLSKYFYHSIVITVLDDNEASALYYCFKNNKYCKSADLSKLEVGASVTTNRLKLN